MLSMEFPDGKTAGWHVGEPFPEISAQVVSFLADGDELAVILAALRPKPQAEPPRSEILDQLSEGLDQALDPELSREELVAQIKVLADLAADPEEGVEADNDEEPQPQAEPAPPSPVELLIHRVENGVAEFAQFDEVPMLEKTKVLALLYQAQAMQRIARAMEARLKV